MPPPSKRQAIGRKVGTSKGYHDENTPLDTAPVAVNETVEAPKPLSRSLKVQIQEKDAIISRLEARICAIETFSKQNQDLSERNQNLSLTNHSLKSLKRKAEESMSREVAKWQKRIKRLERERTTAKDDNTALILGLEAELEERTVDITGLQVALTSARNDILYRDSTIDHLKSEVKEKQATINAIRKRLYASQKQSKRAQTSLKQVQTNYTRLRTWNPKKNGQYHSVSRKLARDLTRAGCAAGKVAFAVESCAEAFGITIRGRFMGRRTVGRAIDEGGKYGDIQLGQEIMNAPGFVESSDGTTHRGITVESRHITILVPSYDPDVDDTDQTTWKHQTRFVEVAPALDHTAKRQFEGTMEAVRRIADTYTRSPLAIQQQKVMEVNDYWRRKLGESKDHAADGKKEFTLSAEYKKQVIIRDLGRAVMEQEDVQTARILLMMLEINDDDLRLMGEDLPARTRRVVWSIENRAALAAMALEYKIGMEKFDALTPEARCNKCTHVFGGCCCHKDLNVVKYGVLEMERVYKTYNLPLPVLLANKANAATIDLTKNPDSAALQHAIDSSSRGAIKLLSLLGSLLRHKDGERGYQDRCGIFMRERKLELYDLEAPGKFPDVSNTRYGCYTYAAAEVVCFPGLIYELITEIIDAKTKSGQKNHVESNILEGLKCAATMTEAVALALYGLSVSWPYMAMVRGTKEKPVNLLSLTDLHRKLPGFCSHIAANPLLLLDSETPLDQLTIDGKPFRDNLIHCIREIVPELPNLARVVSAMFTGCAAGWTQFTPEFHVGGTFDQLTPEQREILFIDATNDVNEGMLGSYRVHTRYHPNSTAHSFSNQTRTERNNTEAFIKKCCDEAVEKYVMREVRKDGASGVRAKFRKAYLGLQREKAAKALKRREKTAARKTAHAAHLADTSLELDISKIQEMTSAKLKDQLYVYRDVLKDEVLLKRLWKDMATVAVRRNLVLEARTRELARRETSNSSPPDVSAVPVDGIIVDEYGYAESEDGEWEDVPE
ncbi:hypothetical protein MSAN_01922500 [Mycena sanguinolenta]|uniref:Uncharacterized protein n=1 Tax=Mycena sanguinolenta TaxID=230812 RepID=A0A8H7CR37_9AGAR|nr:hypothetical protein MSAN_01922500 [Mycena sanguinolenta]